MTTVLNGNDVAIEIQKYFDGAIIGSNDIDIWVKPDIFREVCSFLKSSEEFDMNYLVSISAVDYVEYFELVYHFVSMSKNHSLVLKMKLYGNRESPVASSIVSLWKGADLQEREIWDLLGISFKDHHNMKRILLWEGFPGHPLRKDYID